MKQGYWIVDDLQKQQKLTLDTACTLDSRVHPVWPRPTIIY